eukprot:6210019-Pleurochrysis_carterae.AAC.2
MTVAAERERKSSSDQTSTSCEAATDRSRVEQLFIHAETAVDAAYALHDTVSLDLSAAARAAAMAEARSCAEHAIAQARTSAQTQPGLNSNRKLQAFFWYLSGKLATCGEDGRGCSTAEQLLSDAVKLDPTLVGAWNALGECFWHSGELEAARGCFVGALAHRRNCETLCHLSMLLRAISSSSAG